jgi:hypothetical protein
MLGDDRQAACAPGPRSSAMTQPDVDKAEQLELVSRGLLQGEEVLAVYDCIGTGTGFVGLTTLRVVMQDKSFVGKRVAITSIPYRHVRSVSVVSNTSFAGKFTSSSSIAIDVGGTVHEADFRGVDKAHRAHDLILWYITR